MKGLFVCITMQNVFFSPCAKCIKTTARGEFQCIANMYSYLYVKKLVYYQKRPLLPTVE